MKLLDQVRATIRKKHYKLSTEDAYVSWIKRYIIFHNKQHPTKLGENEISQFISFLAVQRNVAASTRNHLKVNNQRLGGTLSTLEKQGRIIRTLKGWIDIKKHKVESADNGQYKQMDLFENI